MLTTSTSNPNRLSRRAVLGAATAVGVSTGTAAQAARQAPRKLSPPTHQAALAYRTRGRVAVRVFPSYATKVYGQHAAVLAQLADLGVKRMSHKITPAITRDAATIAFTQRAFLDHGIKSWLTVGEPRVPLTPAEWDKIVALLTGPWKGLVTRVYGWNEPNNVRNGGALPADWHVMAAAHQAELWRRVSPLGIQVGTPQLWSGDLARHDADALKLGPLIRGNFDHIGWHLYPRSGGTENWNNIERFKAVYREALGGDFAVICTEGGFLDAVNYTGGAVNHTPEQKATKIPLLVDEYVSRGYGLSYFELLDDPDATEADREASLGLVECKGIDPSTWTPKPAFAALKARLAQG